MGVIDSKERKVRNGDRPLYQKVACPYSLDFNFFLKYKCLIRRHNG
jgi:hypothetical protein